MLGKEQNFSKKESKLYSKKERMYIDGNTKSWGISPEDIKEHTPKQISENKQLAMQLMLPKETLELEASYLEYGYYLNKCIEESRRINGQKYRSIRKVIKKFTNDQANALREMGGQWSFTSQRLSEKVTKKPDSYRQSLLAKIKADIAACKPSIHIV